MKRKSFVLLALLLALCMTAACAQPAAPQSPPARLPAGAAENDVLTFKNNAANKPIVHIAIQYYMPDNSLIETLEAAFPDYLFVLDYAASAGLRAEDIIAALLERDEGAGYDLFITSTPNLILTQEQGRFVDLSAERFLDDYLLSALNSISVGGRIYTIPSTSTLSGIAFNVDMFKEHGWELPKTHDEFFALCETIQAAGVTPFSACFKYTSAVNRLLSMMCYSELFGTTAGAAWLDAVQRGQARFAGRMEPLFELAKRFADAGVVTPDYFTASLTQQRQDFWAGKYAMIDYDSVIFTYAQSENAPFELGIMPYPALKEENAGFAVTPEYFFSLPKALERDPERLALMKRVLAFLSTQEGQRGMISDSLRVSNVRGIDLGENPAMRYAAEAYARGNLYPTVTYSQAPDLLFLAMQHEAIKTLFEGSDVPGAIAHMDALLAEAIAAGKPAEAPPEQLAVAEKDFSTLETSCYIADKLREAANTDVALMLDRGYFCSNLASIQAGQISGNLNRFVMKGVGAKDFLTTYRLSGAQLRELLEHPIINGAEIDALFAASGLVMEYAPWNERGSRVQKLTLADGTPLDGGRLYTVAAWKGAVDARYITETVTEHEELGALTDILAKALRADGTIRPDIAGRLTLLWPTV